MYDLTLTKLHSGKDMSSRELRLNGKLIAYLTVNIVGDVSIGVSPEGTLAHRMAAYNVIDDAVADRVGDCNLVILNPIRVPAQNDH